MKKEELTKEKIKKELEALLQDIEEGLILD